MHLLKTSPSPDQLTRLETRLRAAPVIWQAIDVAAAVLPESYVAGGAVTQTVWNQAVGRPVHEGLKDIDIVYFDPHGNLQGQREAQQALQQCITAMPVDLTNQALTHTWYEARFGSAIPPYPSAEAAIDTWLPAFAVGVRWLGGRLDVYAPYGLHDLFAMHIQPNRLQISQAIYEGMVASFTRRWPQARAQAW